MGVQNFWYHLLDINKQIEWLPGFEPALTDDQIKQAFYDAVPVTWRDRYVHSGKFFQDSTKAARERQVPEEVPRTLPSEWQKQVWKK
jgi:hypothetical protein